MSSKIHFLYFLFLLFASQANPFGKQKQPGLLYCQDACQMRTDLMLLLFATLFTLLSRSHISIYSVYLAMHKAFSNPVFRNFKGLIRFLKTSRLVMSE